MKFLLKIQNLNQSILFIVLLSLSLTGCATTSERLHSQFPSYRRSMGVMLVLIPEICIFEQLPDGSRLFQDIQSQKAQSEAQQFISRQLMERHFTVQTADDEMMQSIEIKNIISLFRSVNRSIQLHTFGPQLYSTKLSAFEYSLGPVDDILKANRADGLVLAIGHQTGSNPPDRNWLSIAVVEPEGNIVWYSIHGDHEKFNIQTSESMRSLVADTMANFWEQGS